jgi:hypothetical protein
MFARTKPHCRSGEEAQGQAIEKKKFKFNLFFGSWGKSLDKVRRGKWRIHVGKFQPS